MDFSTALRLGRVSNLPTVWTNVLAGAALAGAGLGAGGVLTLALAVSFFYVGGMFLNDAFDAEIDAKQRPERPIPSGDVGVKTVFTFGFALLAFGEFVLIARALVVGTGYMTAAAGVLLVILIIAYDRDHKDNRFAPLLMGLSRAMVYVLAGLSGEMAANGSVFLGAGIVVVYLIGLTGIAKQEHLGQMESMLPLVLLAAPFSWVSAFQHAAGIAAYVLLAAWLFIHVRTLVRPPESTRGTGEDADLVKEALRSRKKKRRPPPTSEPAAPLDLDDDDEAILAEMEASELIPSTAPPPRPRDPGIGKAVGGLIAGIALIDALFVATVGSVPLLVACVVCFALTVGLQALVPGT